MHTRSAPDFSWKVTAAHIGAPFHAGVGIRWQSICNEVRRGKRSKPAHAWNGKETRLLVVYDVYHWMPRCMPSCDRYIILQLIRVPSFHLPIRRHPPAARLERYFFFFSLTGSNGLPNHQLAHIHQEAKEPTD
jgi:hypothetical protein